MTIKTPPGVGANRACVKLDMPTPAEVAAQLSHTFTEDQAADIAEYVYQPLRDMLEAMENARVGI